MSQLIIAIYKDTEQAGKNYIDYQAHSSKYRQKIGHMCIAQSESDGRKFVRHAPESSEQAKSSIQNDWFESLVGQVLFQNESMSVKEAGEKYPESDEKSSPYGKVEPAPGSAAEASSSKKGRVKAYESDLISIYGIEDEFVNKVRNNSPDQFSALCFYLDRGESSDLVNELKQQNAQVYHTSMISGEQSKRKAA